MNEGIHKVLSKFRRKSKMSSVDVANLTRNAVAALVDREERRTGSRMTAYEQVAQTVGTSSSWVQKFLSRSNEVKEPRMTLFQNIRASYGQLCERVEQENRNDERRLRLIQGEIDAVTEGFVPEGQD
jgi:U3 small nucleolar RNA-associated protein 14